MTLTGRQELAAALADSESDVVYEKYLGLTGCRVFMPAKGVRVVTVTITLAGIGSIGRDHDRSFRADELNPSANVRGVRKGT